MIEHTVARRYAASLLVVADQAHIVEEIEPQLTAISQAYSKDDLFRKLMNNPRIERNEKKRIMRKLFEGKVNRLLMSFIEIIIEKGRFNLITVITQKFDELDDALKGVVKVQVKTFMPLNQNEKDKLQSKLVQVTGKKISLKELVDKSVLGGLWVKIGDTLIDGTVKGRFEHLKENLAVVGRTL